jgi:hypothetical protein
MSRPSSPRTLAQRAPATIRRYRKSVQELGERASVMAQVELPHLDNDAMVLARRPEKPIYD